MEKIKILIDFSASSDIKKIEEQLIKIRDENKIRNEKYEIDVSFISYGVKIESNIDLLKLPLGDKYKEMLLGGGDNFSKEIEKIGEPYKYVIFIGDFMDLSIDSKAIDKSIGYLFICTQKNNDIETNYVKNIINNKNVYKTNIDEYSKLDDYFNKFTISPFDKKIKVIVKESKINKTTKNNIAKEFAKQFINPLTEKDFKDIYNSGKTEYEKEFGKSFALEISDCAIVKIKDYLSLSKVTKQVINKLDLLNDDDFAFGFENFTNLIMHKYKSNYTEMKAALNVIASETCRIDKECIKDFLNSINYDYPNKKKPKY